VTPVVDVAHAVSLLPDFLQRQRWYGAGHRTLERVEAIASETLRADPPLLLWMLAEAHFADGSTATYQVPIGARPLSATERFLEGKGRGFLGDVDTDEGPFLLYDALVDPELAVALAGVVAPSETVHTVRPLNVEQSNTSMVFDERLILKVFRQVPAGPNPDVEVTRALAKVGFGNISAPVAEWSRGDRDLAVMRQYLVGATDGWTLAQTSLRDLYDSRVDPATSGGDFAPDAHRLGEVTAQLHLALADAFGTEPAAPGEWADDMLRHLERVRPAIDEPEAVAAVYERLRKVPDPGPSMRVHGDYHLGQTMRADAGWFILDFEGEPARPLAERRRHSSTVRDVAGMLRSFHYASQVVLLERADEVDDELAVLAADWDRRASDAFLGGYLDADDIGELLPDDDASLDLMLDAFLLDKAVYEVGYELAHRPPWAAIPRAAIERLLAAI
jgi:maltokinase